VRQEKLHEKRSGAAGWAATQGIRRRAMRHLNGGIMHNRTLRTLVAAAAFALPLASFAQAPVKIYSIVELSGGGATAGTNFDNGLKLAFKEINAAGGILGRKIDVISVDTQSNPGIAKALTQKAIDDKAYVIMGPVFSGSIIVSMEESKRAEIPNFTGGEAASITQKGNPYVFRTSFTQDTAMPKVAKYLKNNVKANTVALMWVNNDFGKGGRDSIMKALEAQGIKVVADISTDPGQVDFSGAVLKAKQSNADALFVYTNEEESARALRELKKQGYDKPIIGETTLTGQKVIELAGEAANGAIAHVGLTADAPQPAIKAFDEKFQKEYKYKSDHNGMKGYSAMYVVKAVTEKNGKVDSKLLANALHGAKISAKDNPGVLLDVSFDQNGDLDRESFLVKVVNGKQVVTETLPPAGK
jgi:branched-chain amino acid transport system substrate-binding protein